MKPLISEIGTNLRLLPHGMARNGEAATNCIKWVSRYVSVIASAYDVSTFNGMNEKGLGQILLSLWGSTFWITLQLSRKPLKLSLQNPLDTTIIEYFAGKTGHSSRPQIPGYNELSHFREAVGPG